MREQASRAPLDLRGRGAVVEARLDAPAHGHAAREPFDLPRQLAQRREPLVGHRQRVGHAHRAGRGAERGHEHVRRGLVAALGLELARPARARRPARAARRAGARRSTASRRPAGRASRSPRRARRARWCGRRRSPRSRGSARSRRRRVSSEAAPNDAPGATPSSARLDRFGLATRRIPGSDLCTTKTTEEHTCRRSSSRSSWTSRSAPPTTSGRSSRSSRSFMEGVEEVRQIDDTHLHWVAEIGGVTRGVGRGDHRAAPRRAHRLDVDRAASATRASSRSTA